jgi:signal transduction histidine kinase
MPPESANGFGVGPTTTWCRPRERGAPPLRDHERLRMLRTMPIRVKLIATLIGPVLVLTVFALLGIRTNLAASDRADRVNQAGHLAASLDPLIHALQAERSGSATYIADDRRTGAAELRQLRVAVDDAVDAWETAREQLRLDRVDARLAEKVGYGTREVERLPEQRTAIDTKPITAEDFEVEPGLEAHEEEGEEHPTEGHGPIDTPGKALDQYTDTINDLLDVNLALAPDSGDERLFETLTASIALSRAKDFSDLRRALLHDALTRRRFRPGQYGKLTSLVAAETVYLAQFNNVASPEQSGLLSERLEDSRIEQAHELLEAAVEAGEGGRLKGNPDAWLSVTAFRQERLRDVEERLSDDIVATSASIKATADRQALIYSLVLATSLALAIVLFVLTARSIIRPLRRLEATAEEVARHRLPDVVDRLAEGKAVDLEAESAPILVRSGDEIGRVAIAFNSVHRAAVRLAGKEAALRRNAGELFLDLSRRNQGLIDNQLAVLGRMSPGPPVPTLDAGLEADLMALGAIATRMRRNARNLLVLSGAGSTRRWRRPLPIAEVVAMAAAEIPDGDRIQLLRLGEAIVDGQAVADLVHLLAELFDNAVEFSPPGVAASIGGEPLHGGYFLEVEDRGVGMTDEQLAHANERLRRPPEAGLADGKMLGFTVVGRLAARHGIKVQVRHSWYGGVAALVRLPVSILDGLDAHATEPTRRAVGPSPVGAGSGDGGRYARVPQFIAERERS